MLKKLFIFALSGGLLCTPVLSGAQDDRDPVNTYRQKVMQSIGANIGAISDILKHSLPHQGNIQAHAEQINSAAALVPSAFEEQVTEGLTDAKPEIWEQWSEFEEYSSDLEDASANLAEVAAGGDMGAIGGAVKELGDTCKQCHEDFRKPKEESYKQQM